MKSVTIKCNSKQDSALMHHALKLDLKVTTAARRENKSFLIFKKFGSNSKNALELQMLLIKFVFYFVSKLEKIFSTIQSI